MAEGRLARKLAAILCADVVGYSRLMGLDEGGTLSRLNSLRRDLLDPTVAAHSGRVVKLIGDGTLVEFSSVVDAVSCAIEIQARIRQPDGSELAPLRLRIGIHVGDIIIERDDIYGDGVNIAARIEAIAEPDGILLSEDAWRQVRGKIAADFVDTGEQNLKNIPTPVRVYRVDFGELVPSAPQRVDLSVPDKPSIAVLPFQNISGDREQDYFCDGLVEDIITTLSKLSGLRVIARNSSTVYKGRSVDVREAAKQLGARYILEGSVRKSGNRLRITTQLIDATDGSHLWAERFDRTIDDIFAIQDEITLVLATEMQVRLTEGEQARLRYTTTSNVEAWTLWVQGLSQYHQAITKEKIGAARQCWEHALALDPNSAALNAMLGLMHVLDARFGWWDDRAVAVGKASTYAGRALNIEPTNADAHITSGCVSLLERQYDAAVADARKAVELAPGSADVAMLASFILVSSGYANEALTQVQKAIDLTPNYPPALLGNLGNALRQSGRIEEAIAAFKEYDFRVPGSGLVDLVVAYQAIGRPDDAKRAVERLLAVRKNFTIASWVKTQFRRDAAQLEQEIAALRSAGLPN